MYPVVILVNMDRQYFIGVVSLYISMQMQCVSGTGKVYFRDR